ncbi:hypothetical protein ON010_g8308 [Phytophthora cinnamomi]|nr:hypothetical protein ON010_g8308 [Phytophthora cinnamomi]
MTREINDRNKQDHRPLADMEQNYQQPNSVQPPKISKHPHGISRASSADRSTMMTGRDQSTSTTPLRRQSIRKSSIVRTSTRIVRHFNEWKSEHMNLGRYSIEKMLAFEEYQRVASYTRVFAVILLTPLPGLLVILMVAAIPLKSPVLGVRENATFFVQSFLIHVAMTFSLLLFIRCSLGLPLTVYSHGQSAVVSVVAAALNETLMLGVALIWEFPIPFRGVVGIPPFLILLLILHGVLLRLRLRDLRIDRWKYTQLLFAQISILVIFQGVAVLFAHSPVWGQAIIIVGISLLRVILKRVIWRLSGCLDDISTDVGVCVVEIFGSLFQNVCLQNCRSFGVSALIIAMDFFQAIIETRLYLEHNFVVDGRQTTQTAVKILEGALHFGVVNAKKPRLLSKQRPDSNVVGVTHTGKSVRTTQLDLIRKPKRVSIRQSHAKSISKVAATFNRSVNAEAINLDDFGSDAADSKSKVGQPVARTTVLIEAIAPKLSTIIDDVQIPHRHHAKLLFQALQLVFASEVLVFAEYAEFACSVLYGLYTAALYHLPYAQYNLFFIGLSQNQFRASIANSFGYALFEGVSMVLFFVLVRSKYGLSTFHQLAFVLEKYWMSVQGKVWSVYQAELDTPEQTIP